MKISYNWLQKYFKDKLPSPEKISEGIIFHAFEVESVEKLEQDWVFDIKVLPDRAHDCLSHWGIAKEISVIFDLEINPELELEFWEEVGQEVGPLGIPRSNLNRSNLNRSNLGMSSNLEIQIQFDKCRRYMGQIIHNVKVGPSPKGLKDSLEAIGQKSINNVVDATNYIMFDLGNPIHAFDLDKLEGSKIIVRNAKTGEKFVTLDKKNVELDESIMIIADEKDPLAIAGVKGGTKAEVDSNTKNLIIEVANFDPVAVRKTAKKLGIFTDSAKRFENEISPALVSLVMDKISNLILEVAGGEFGDLVDNYPQKVEKRSVKFSSEYINKILGVKISEEEIKKILNKYHYISSPTSGVGEEWGVEVPILRPDITSSCDMAEEIGRIYGYDKIKPEIPKIEFTPKDDLVWRQINQAKVKLISEGYREIMNYTFTDKGEVEVLASASDKKFLRTNLSDGIKKSYELNKINLPLLGDDEVKIFEIGNIFKKNKEEINVCLADKSGVKEMSLEDFLREDVGPEVGQEVGPLGIPRSNLNRFNLKGSDLEIQYFNPWSQYPFITRDIAVWVPSEIKPEKLSEIYNEFGTELLVCEPKLFDQFTKPAKEEGEVSKTSYAHRLVFQSYEKTLTDEEVNVIMGHIEEKISDLGWVVR